MIDVFSGAGGLTLGFTQAFGGAFRPVWAIDSDQAAASTYVANFGAHCVVADILDVLSDRRIEIPAADVVIGGPPCQGFSLLNRQRADDSRKQLWRPFLDIVERSGASAFVMENVPQLLRSPEISEIVEGAESLGFQIVAAELCAADYGVAQLRRRAFVVGCRGADPAQSFPPEKTHFNPRNGALPRLLEGIGGWVREPQPWRTVRDEIGNLPPPVGTAIRDEPPPFDLQFGRSPTDLSVKRYQAIPEEGMNRKDLERLAPELTLECWKRKKSGGTDLFGRLWWDQPAHTIRTEFWKPEKGRYLHPSQHRAITHREAARLQSFPDSFQFVGTKVDIGRQIGNAVPPLLARRVAETVYDLLVLSLMRVDDDSPALIVS